jgi:hypothetical protein
MAAAAASRSLSTEAAEMVDVIYEALAERRWEEAHRYMDALIGAEGAARWLSLELEIAGVIPTRLERSNLSGGDSGRPGESRDLPPSRE